MPCRTIVWGLGAAVTTTTPKTAKRKRGTDNKATMWAYQMVIEVPLYIPKIKQNHACRCLLKSVTFINII